MLAYIIMHASYIILVTYVTAEKDEKGYLRKLSYSY